MVAVLECDNIQGNVSTDKSQMWRTEGGFASNFRLRWLLLFDEVDGVGFALAVSTISSFDCTVRRISLGMALVCAYSEEKQFDIQT